MRMSTTCRVELFESLDASLTKRWEALEARAGVFVFQRHQWLRHWLRTIGNSIGADPLIVILSEEGIDHVLLPFTIKLHGGVRILEILGADMADYSMPICTSEGRALLQQKSSWKRIFSALPRHDVFHLVRLAESPVESGLFPFTRDAPFISDKADAATLPESWEQMLQRFSSKHKRDLRGKMRKLQALGRVEFEIFKPEEPSYSEAIDALIAQKRARCHATGAPDLYCSLEMREFYAGMPSRLGKGADLLFCGLTFEGRVIASSWGVVENKSYYILVLTFDPEYSKYSVGKLQVEAVLRHCIASGLAICDFTYGGEEFKKMWCDREQPLYDLLHARSVAGNFYVASIKAMNLLRNTSTVHETATFVRRQFYRIKNQGGTPRTVE